MTSTEYETFIANARSINRKFLDKTDQLKHGKLPLSPDKNAGPLRAYLIAYRFEAVVAQIIGAVSKLISEAVPGSVTYGADNAHTTVTDYRLERDADDKYRMDGSSPLEDMLRCVERALGERRVSDELACNYAPCLSNGEAVIAPGLPTRPTWDLNQRILELLNEKHIDAGGSWGGHATVARFTTAVPAGDPAIAQLTSILSADPALGHARLAAIEVSTFYVRPDTGFEIFPYESFPL